MQSLIDERLWGELSTADMLRIHTESLYPSIRHIYKVYPSNRDANAINTVDVDRQRCELLLCGSSDSSIHIYSDSGQRIVAKSKIQRKQGHQFGVSHVSWWPRDTELFVSSSFDHTVKVWDTGSLEDVYTFDLGSRVYHFDISTNSQQPLLACGNDTPMVRLLDMRTTSTTHTLTGHKGRVLALKWSPVNSNLLVSGDVEGNVRLWDIRRGESCVYQFNSNDTLDDNDDGEVQTSKRRRTTTVGKAHDGAVNGIAFTERGDEVITCGIDEKIRVWDLTKSNKATNKLVNFGPLVRNKYTQHIDMCLTPQPETEMQFLWFPNDNGEILVFRVVDGKLIARLSQGADTKRVTCIKYAGFRSSRYYSGSLDGSVNVWARGSTLKERPGKILLSRTDNDQEQVDEPQQAQEGPSLLDRIHAEMEAKKLFRTQGLG